LSDHRTDGIDVLIEPLALLLDDPIVVGRNDRRVGAQGIGGGVYFAGEEVFHSAEQTAEGTEHRRVAPDTRKEKLEVSMGSEV